MPSFELGTILLVEGMVSCFIMVYTFLTTMTTMMAMTATASTAATTTAATATIPVPLFKCLPIASGL